MDPTQTHTRSAVIASPTPAALRRASEERWKALPSVIRSTFDCARRVPMSQSLKAMGVDVTPARSLEWAYETMRGTLVVSVWHDHIDVEADGSLAYRIDSVQSQPEGKGAQAARAERMRVLLAAHVGREVQVLLLKRGWASNDTQKAERNAPDLRKWVLESAGEDRFVLRRAVLRKAA
jgi:hypothetical protein